MQMCHMVSWKLREYDSGGSPWCIYEHLFCLQLEYRIINTL